MREICCAVIDLKSGASDLLELGPQALESAGAAAHFCLLKPIWTEREDPVALSPGMLSGTGVPGSGGMTWCCPGAEGLTLTAAEGRLGAMLRYAGVEHLLFCGSCEGGQTVDVLVHDGRISVTKHARTQGMPAGRIYAEARKRQPDENSVIAVFTASGVLEDDCFSVGDRALSARLRKKGLRSLTVAASGGVPVARPRQFTDQCVALWESWRQHRPEMEADAAHPAHYLSIRSREQEPVCPLEDAPPGARAFAALGLFWGEQAGALGGFQTAAALAGAYLGSPVTPEGLEALDAGMRGGTGNEHSCVL